MSQFREIEARLVTRRTQQRLMEDKKKLQEERITIMIMKKAKEQRWTLRRIMQEVIKNV
jgi:hypothetical protein